MTADSYNTASSPSAQRGERFDQEARRFASADHLAVDAKNRVVYRGEIRTPTPRTVSDAGSLIGFANRYAPRATAHSFEVRFVP